MGFVGSQWKKCAVEKYFQSFLSRFEIVWQNCSSSISVMLVFHSVYCHNPRRFHLLIVFQLSEVLNGKLFSTTQRKQSDKVNIQNIVLIYPLFLSCNALLGQAGWDLFITGLHRPHCISTAEIIICNECVQHSFPFVRWPCAKRFNKGKYPQWPV